MKNGSGYLFRLRARAEIRQVRLYLVEKPGVREHSPQTGQNPQQRVNVAMLGTRQATCEPAEICTRAALTSAGGTHEDLTRRIPTKKRPASYNDAIANQNR